MILSATESELGLQEQIRSRYQPVCDGSRDRLPHGGLMIVAPLVGGIDAAKALLQRQLRKPLRIVLFPRGAIEEMGDVLLVIERAYPTRSRS